FLEHLSRAAGANVEEEELEIVLFAIEHEHREGVRATRPVEARHVVLATLMRVEPHGAPRVNIDGADPHRRIRVPRLGNANAVPGGMPPAVVGELNFRFLALVDSPERSE